LISLTFQKKSHKEESMKRFKFIILFYFIVGCVPFSQFQKTQNYVPAELVKPPKNTDVDDKAQTEPVASKKYKKKKTNKKNKLVKKRKFKVLPHVIVEKANKKARQEPASDDYFDAITKYQFSEGALYQVYTAPKHITDISLQPGETLNGSPCAGDTINWKLVHTISGTGKTAIEHIYVKPVKPGLETNLIITTNKRSYYIQLKSFEITYMTGVSWNYQDDKMIGFENKVLRGAIGVDLSLNDLNFNYKIEGEAPFKPIAVFDDDKNKTYIQFSPSIAQTELPPLFVLSSEKKAQLVNYRYSVANNYFVVDCIFESAMLKMGTKKQEVVYIYNLSLKKRHNWFIF